MALSINILAPTLAIPWLSHPILASSLVQSTGIHALLAWLLAGGELRGLRPSASTAALQYPDQRSHRLRKRTSFFDGKIQTCSATAAGGTSSGEV